MKIRIYYQWSNTGPDRYGHAPHLIARAETDEPRKPEWFERDAQFTPSEWGEIALARGFSTYLFGSLLSEFSENRYGHVDLVLSAVAKVEGAELDEYEWEGQGFTAHITRDRVRFEHSIFNECPEWPIWCCTLAQYKAALQGYRRFLDMPRSIESELIIELPDGETRCD
jgi:hypothetical protein